MEKKFLDKQGLAELCKSFQDEFVNKGDMPTKVSQLDNDKNYLSADALRRTSLFRSEVMTTGNFNTMPFQSGMMLITAVKGRRGQQMLHATNFPCGLGGYVVYTTLPYTPAANGELIRAGKAFQVIVSLNDMRVFYRMGTSAMAYPKGVECNWGELSEIKPNLADMKEDSEHRTITDAERQKLSNIKEQIVLTEAEYNALSAEAKNDNTKIYFIKAE